MSAKTEATQRMSRHRDAMKARGFKQLSLHVPQDVNAFLETEKRDRRLASKGDAVAALVAEVTRYRQLEEEGRRAG
ncbi:MAG: hypothetical protein WBF53_12850 [Litorimonas sp.]